MTDKNPTSGPPGSRARPGGSARPASGAGAESRRPTPPSFAPQGAQPPRPAHGEDAIAVGSTRRPAVPTTPEKLLLSPTPARASGSPVVKRPPVGARTPAAPASATPAPGPEARHRRRRRVVTGIVVLLVALLAWPIGLMVWANGKVQHVAALSGAASTPGTTYLLAGSDSRADGTVGNDGTQGARSDTIMLLHVPQTGPAALISLPRDSYVEIPGKGKNKLNAAFAWGGAPLLVKTVEKLTGMTVDHYVEIGFAGIENVVNAVGGVNLCLDYNVADKLSGLIWASGCHDTNGVTALAFARMRYGDPEGDIGRAKRQQQLIAAITHKVENPALVLQPGKQVSLVTAGTGALAVDQGSGIVDLGRLALDFRSATGATGIQGTPPIKNMSYQPGGVGSTVQLDPAKTPAFFAAIMNGTLPAGKVGGAPAA
jgi:LCP family protein required for cell wall assembly